MRILFVSSLYPPRSKGGGEVSTHYLAQGLRERGHDVVVLSTSPDSLRHEDLVDEIPVIRVPINLTAKPLFERAWATRAAAQLATELDRHSAFDMVHCHDFRSAQVVALLGLPHTLVTVRDYAFICGSPNNLLADGTPCPGCESILAVMKNRAVVEAPLLRKPFRVWQYWYNIDFRKETLRAFAHQIYISAAQEKTIAKRLALRGSHRQVIYNPVPTEYLKARPTRPISKTLLFVGTVESYKGVGLLLEVFRSLSQKHRGIELQIVGDGAQRKVYEQHVKQWGLQYQVRFLGHIPHERMLGVYDDAWLVVTPHIWQEPFGRVVVEAMSRERIVIAANIGGPAELIQDGTTGFLFEAGRRESLFATLDHVIRLPDIDRREVQRAARAWVSQHLTPDSIAQQYERVYQVIAKA